MGSARAHRPHDARFVGRQAPTAHPRPRPPNRAGAERLVVDAATELAERGHEASWRVGGFAASGPPAARRRPAACCLDPLPPPPTGRLSQVTIYTPFHDPDRCFPETTSGAFRVLVEPVARGPNTASIATIVPPRKKPSINFS